MMMHSSPTAMCSPSPVPSDPFRILSSPPCDIPFNPGLALGRHHASWFLVYARRPMIQSQRVVLCLNFLVPGDPNSVEARSPSGNPVFTVGGYGVAARKVLDALRGLRDENGHSPVVLTEQYAEGNEYGLLADVEVLIPENELIQACAHCGTWETQYGPRFLRCGGCKSRWYCSAECQQDDWKLRYHKGECRLLHEGKAFEVESRRKLHNNGWYFDYGAHGDQTLLEDTGPHTYERAVHANDVSFLAYGRRYPPHDVVPPTTPRPPLVRRSDGYPPGFVPTGDTRVDSTIRHLHALKAHARQAAGAPLPETYPVSDAVPAHAIPVFPPLPAASGFVPTGDPFLDQSRLCAHLHAQGMEAEHDALGKVTAARQESIEERERLDAERWERTRRLMYAAREELYEEYGVSSPGEFVAIACPDGAGGESLAKLQDRLREEQGRASQARLEASAQAA
ncbi:hypothetical protein OH76DRAFT_1405526 [Lentinus brumalis]|uniref:MYND-type domain-containing protein n=1 Tax=Lentinus brumalis TaxID=2498619 RepID=A0A371D5D3_9APHY|nr:hypothetical protein OH76DRAFT_1405526 [Polyporus brumalis]